MLDVRDLKVEDLQGLDPVVVAALAPQMLAHIHEQIRQLQQRDQHIERQARDIRFKDTKLEKVTFELARLKAYRFSAKTESMNAEQRQMFEGALAEDQRIRRAWRRSWASSRANCPSRRPLTPELHQRAQTGAEALRCSQENWAEAQRLGRPGNEAWNVVTDAVFLVG